MKNITFINAGAGSGKTYRLTQELNKAISDGECKAHQVLLTTFTKKAAEEIKIKARENLLKDNKFNEANDLQNAYIGTVHSVGQQIIQKFWHYIGFPKEIKVMDDADTNFYFTQAIAEIPTTDELNRLTDLSYKFNFQGDFGIDTGKWKQDLLKIIELARINHISDFTNSKIKSLDYASKVFNSNDNIVDYNAIVPVVDMLIEIGSNIPDKGNKKLKNAAKELIKVKKDNIQYSQLKKIKDTIDMYLKKEYIDIDVTEVSNKLEGFHRSKTLINDIEEYNNLLFDIAEKSIEKYAQYKKEIGLIDYSDMENGLLKLLEIGEVQKEIRDTVKLVMVDEFQDSSPIQLAIFIKLSEISNRSVWVGDPKQSIYAFRGTDPVLIDAIVNKFETKQGDNLTTDNLEFSWRSRPEIVDCVNKIFKPALKNQVKEENIALKKVRTNKEFNKSALHHFNFEEYNANGKLDSTNDAYHKAVAKSVVKLLKEKWTVSNKSKSVPNKDDKAKEIVVVNTIKASDIAILCKTNEDVNTVSQELNNLGIKVSSESDNLKNTAEYFLIISLIKLLLSQQNVLAKAEVKLLSETDYSVASLIDDRLEFLNKLPEQAVKPNKDDYSKDDYKTEIEKYNDLNEDYYKKLNSWGSENLLINGISSIFDSSKELPVPQLVEYLVSRLNIYSIVTSWNNARQRQDNVQKIIDYAYKYDERCINMNLGASIFGFIHYLQSQDSLTESKSDSNDAVNVLTYHKSKGLEWPLVMLCDLQKDVNWGFIARNIFGIFIENKSEIDLDAILKDRNIISMPWVFGVPSAKISDDFDTYIEDTDEYKIKKTKHDNELKRIMYVGMTRSRDYMVTTSISGTKKYPWMQILNQHDNWTFKDFADVETGSADIFNRGINIEVQKLELNNEDKIAITDVNKYFSGKEINAEHSSESYFISPSKVQSDADVKVSVYADIQNRIPTGSSAKDKVDILGNCLHDILYLYIGNKLNNDIKESLKNAENIIINHKIDSIIDAKDVLNSIDKLYDYINKEFKPIQWHRELPIETEIEGQLYKGEVDLLLETNKGFILIDYKSYPGSMERVLDASSKNSPKSNYAGIYAGQLNTYTKMLEDVTDKKVLKKLIYYTVLGQLVEIEI